MKQKARIALIILAAVIGAVLLTVVGAFIVLGVRTEELRDDCTAVFEDEKYMAAVNVDGVDVIKQEVACG